MGLLPTKKDAEAQRRPPAFLKLRSSKTFILTVVGAAIFTDLFLYGVIVPVLPFALNSRANVPEASVQHWVSVMLAVYSAGLLALSPVWGWCADHTKSRAGPFLCGLVMLVGATALLLVGNSIAIIVLGRLLQGISAALVWTVGLAIVSDTVDPEGLGEAMGWIMLGLGVAVFTGPLLGGVVFARGGYYAVFIMTFGVIAVDIVMRLLMIEVKVAKQWLDVETSTAALADASTSEQVATVNESTAGTTSAPTPTALSAPTSTSAAPVTLTEKKRRRPVLIILLSSTRLLSGLWGCMVAAILNTSFDAVLPLYVANTFGWNSTGAGLIFIPLFLPTFIQPLIGQLGDRLGYRWLVFAGFLGVFPTLILLRLVYYESIEQKVLLCALLALTGLWSSCILPNLFAEVTVTVTDREKEEPGVFGETGAFAQAYALFNAAYGAGSLVGPLWAGFVNQSAGWGVMTLSLACLSGFSALPAVLLTGGYLFADKGPWASWRARNDACSTALDLEASPNNSRSGTKERAEPRDLRGVDAGDIA